MFGEKKQPPYVMYLKNTYISNDKWRLFKLRGKWVVYSRDGELVDTLDNAAGFQARKALRWWNKFGPNVKTD